MDPDQVKVNSRPNHAITIDKSLKGLGGWLGFFQFSLYTSLLLGIITIIVNIIPIYGSEAWETLTDPSSVAYDPLWKPLIIFETVGNIISMLLIILILVMLYAKKSMLPKLVIIMLVYNILLVAVDYSLLQQISLVDQIEDANSTKEISRSILYACVWIPYFLRSKRVRNTFVN